MIRLLIADDQALVRGALAALLDLEPDLTVVAQVGRGDEVLPALAGNEVDVVLLDIEMPGLDGIEVAGQLNRQGSGVKVLIVTTFGRPGYLRRALDAGVAGFIVKDSSADELADAVRRVAAGLRVVDPSLAADSLFEGANPLSPREQDVLRCVLTGASTAQIGEKLHLSAGTVRNYLSSATAKTHTQSSIQAALTARDQGWL